jgi:hypothetical protein
MRQANCDHRFPQLAAIAPVLAWVPDKGLSELPHKTPAEVVTWLEANLPSEPWGNIRDDEDAGEYTHRMHHTTWSDVDDAFPGGDE